MVLSKEIMIENNPSQTRSFTVAFAFLICLIAGIWVWYIFQVDPILPMYDQYPLLQEFDQGKKEGFSLGLLWSSKGGHVYPGYKLTFFLNCMFFGFLPKLEIFLSIFTFGLAVFYITNIFASELTLPKPIVILFGLMVMLLFMNWQTVYLSTYSLVAARLMNFSLFVLTSVLCFRFLSISNMPGKDYLLKGMVFFLIVCLTILFFGRGWGIAAALAMIALTGLHFMSNWIQNGFRINQHIVVLISLLIVLPVYFARLESGSDGPLDVMKAGAFALNKFGHAGLRMFDNGISLNVMVNSAVSVLFLILTTLFSLNYMFREQITKAVWIALFLIYFSILATLLVTASRYTGSPFYPRHNMETSMGWAGMVFLLVKFLDGQLKGRFRQVLPALLIAMFAVPAAYGNFKNYSTHKYLKNFNLRVKDNFIAAYTNPAAFDKNFSSMACPRNRETCLSIIDIMKEHGVSQSVVESAKPLPVSN